MPNSEKNQHIKRSIIWTYDSTEKDIFTNIYKKNLWGNEESVSGAGSTLEATQNFIKELPKLIDEYKITTLLDIACGDFNWMSNINLNLTKYIGVDIVSEIIESNKLNHSASNKEFYELNIISDKIPQVDLILCRECFIHLNNLDILRALKNIKNSKSKYLLTTTYTDIMHNIDILTGLYRPINLQKPPFLLPDPLILIIDNNFSTSQKFMALWQIENIPDF